MPRDRENNDSSKEQAEPMSMCHELMSLDFIDGIFIDHGNYERG
jgi:hypothetical protein